MNRRCTIRGPLGTGRLLLGLLAAGCAHSEPNHLALTQVLDDLANRQPTHAEVGAAAKRLGRTVDPGDGLDLAEAETVALTFAPRVRAARLAAEGASRVVDATGAWPTPTLTVEALGVVSGGGSPPLRVGAGVAFPIPLSDRLDAAVSEAGAEREAAVLAAAVEEWRAVVALRHGWFRWTLAQRQAEALEAHVARLAPFLEVAQKLAAAGELEPEAVDLWRLAAERYAGSAVGAHARARRAKAALARLMGVRDLATLRLQPSLEVPATTPLPVAEHPEVRLALAELQRAQAAKRRADAEAAGDLQLGPNALYEEGTTALGATLGVPLGRSASGRRASAAAEAEAQNAAEQARGVIFDVTARAREAALDAENARERAVRLERDYAPRVAAQLARMKRLVGTGEFSLVSLRETLELALELENQLLEARAEAASALAEPPVAPPAASEGAQ